MSQTVIVFQEDCLLAAVGREAKYPALSKVKRIELARQGEMFERWQQAFFAIPEEWKRGSVRFVLPAGICSTRVLHIPYGKGKQLEQMAQREVADSFKEETADYSVLFLEKKSNVDLCAGGVSQNWLEQFLKLCAKAGVTVGGITVPMEGYLRLLGAQTDGKLYTAIYLFFEEGSVTSILCQQGRYLYSSRSRLFSEPGTLDFGTEIVRNISGILQFYSSSEGGLPITDVYYAGCPAEDFEVGIEGIKGLNLKVSPMEIDKKILMPQGERAADWTPCIGALMRKDRFEKEINLYQIYKKRSEKAGGGQRILKQMSLPVTVAVICLLPTIVVAGLNLAAEGEIRRLDRWINADETKEQYELALALENRLSSLDHALFELQNTKSNLDTYPDVSGDVLQKIEEAGGHRIEFSFTGYRAEDGVLTFDASSKEIIDIPAYVLNLQRTGLFYTVDYTGYDYENEWYRLSLSCVMKGKDMDKEQTAGGAK